MITFIIGFIILIVGGFLYGKICEAVFKPDDRKTPAVLINDGMDYVPMKKWKNGLIQLLNIAGTGPILGPIQGILFGPIAFITIPIGCVIGGAFHDYMCGMISVRNNGEQMPSLIHKFLGKYTFIIYNIFICILMLLVGAVFVYTPGDIFITHILKGDSSFNNPITWIIYGIIFIYYIIATLLPIDKIIGKIYPIFGGMLILSAIGILVGLIVKGYPLDEIWEVGFFNVHPQKLHFMPIFFVTVACGIVSGFHSTQATIVSRTMSNEKEGRFTFYNMMIAEGIIAMIWSAAAMGVIKLGLADASTSPTKVVGIVSDNLLGGIGSLIAIIGIIVLPITSGDTALRSLRLIITEFFNIKQSNKKKNMTISILIFIIVAILLIFSKNYADGFNILWRYFAWANQAIAVFAFSMISIYMLRNKQPFIMALIPGIFYMFVVSSFILNATIGFGLNWTASYVIAAIITIIYAVVVIEFGKKGKL